MQKRTWLIAFGSIITTLLVWIFQANPAPQILPSPEFTVSNEPTKIDPKVVMASNSWASEENLSSESQEKANAIFSNFQKGNYLETLEMVQLILSSPQHSNDLKSWAEQQLPIILTSLGWQKFQKNAFHEAISFFEEALLYRREPLALKGLAGSYYKLNLFWQAEYYGNQFLELNPNDFDTYFLLFETMESTQNFYEARELLQKLESVVDLDASQKLSLERKAKSITAKIKESKYQSTASTANFMVSYRPDLHEEIVPWLLDFMESSLDEFHLDWQFDYPSTPIEVILYPDDSFRDMIHGPLWIQAIFDGRIRIPFSNTNERQVQVLERTVRHELIHALLAQASLNRPLPPWFNEGIAQLLECHGSCALGVLRTHEAFLDAETFQRSFIGLDQRRAQRAYQQSLWLIHILIQSKGRQAIAQIIEGLRHIPSTESNQILKLLGTNFQELYDLARRQWDSKKP